MVKITRRKQRGGSFWAKFPTLSFRLTLPSKIIKENLLSWSEEEKRMDNLSKPHKLELFEGDIRICDMNFTPIDIDNEGFAYLDYIECRNKTKAFKRVSFLMIYKFLEILRSMEIEYVNFVVAAKDNYWKLFNLYHEMGFACLPRGTELPEDKMQAFKTQIENNEKFFIKELKNIDKLGKENSKKSAFRMFNRCNTMYGYIPEVMNKIEQYVAAQKGGKQKRKTRKND